MVKEKKIRCDCGLLLIERKTKFDKFKTEGMVCSKCSFITLTKEQADRYTTLR